MTLKTPEKSRTIKSVARAALCAGLLGMAAMVPSTTASAGDSAAPIQPLDPATRAAYGDNMPLLSSSGAVVTGNAWCDPISGVCQMHPWTHHHRF